MVYELAPPATTAGAWTEAVLYSFTGDADGGGPSAPVAFGAGGEMYGTTSGGPGLCPSSGIPGCGVVFELTPPRQPGGAWAETVLHEFGKSGDGIFPFSGVVIGKNGALYGTTLEGGAYDEGIVFELKPPSVAVRAWTETILYNFTDQNGDGGFPNHLTPGANGVFYGTTAYGGATGNGMVFEMKLRSVAGGAWTETVIHSFDNAIDGFAPSASVIIGTGRVLYGVTSGGGPNGTGGAVFALDPPTVAGGAWQETVLYAFSPDSDLPPRFRFGPPGPPILSGKIVKCRPFNNLVERLILLRPARGRSSGPTRGARLAGRRERKSRQPCEPPPVPVFAHSPATGPTTAASTRCADCDPA